MVGSYETVGLEQSYFLAYAALDAAVGAAADDSIQFTLGASAFRKLCSKLRKTLTEFAVEHRLSGLVDDVADKLVELQRRSTARKMERLYNKLGFTVDDLWKHIGFETGFKRATRARNELVHSATVADPEQISRDLVRLHVLTERILLKLLEWPDNKIWRWYDQELRWMNHREDPSRT